MEEALQILRGKLARFCEQIELKLEQYNEQASPALRTAASKARHAVAMMQETKRDESATVEALAELIFVAGTVHSMLDSYTGALKQLKEQGHDHNS
jgi:hypothetical protein